MTRNRVWYALFFAACLIFSAAYRSRLSAVLLAAAIAYPLLALIFTAISVFTVRAGFGESRGVYEKNEQFELPVYLVNNFIFPFAPAELDCMLPDNDSGLFLRKQVYVSVAPLKKMRIFLPCMHRYRGSYPAQIMKISVYDPLKLIRITRRMESTMQLVILPRKIPLEQLGFVFGGDKGSVPEPIINGEKEDFSHVREYLDGDILQLIHWKLTAKQQELMIKQYEADGDRRAVILCNFAGAAASPSAVLRRSDAVIETAVAVALSAAEAGIKAVADTGAFVSTVCEISDRSGFDRFYDMMSVIPPNPETVDFTQLVKKYACGDSAAMFLITPTVDEEILDAAESAAANTTGTVVLIYINCTGKSDYSELRTDRRYVFAEISGETEKTLPDAAEQILADFLRLK